MLGDLSAPSLTHCFSMVFGFAILSLTSEPITSPPNALSSLNQILFSYFYSREGNDELKEARLEVIYKKIIDEFQFRKIAELGIQSNRNNTKEGLTLEWPNFSIGDSPKYC